MKRAEWLKATNIVLFIVAGIQGVSGISLFMHGPEFLEEIHKFNGFLLLGLVVVHLVLNWGWVKSNFLKGK